VRFGLVGGSYTAVSTNVADEETINWFQETREGKSGVAPLKVYGGSAADSCPSLIRTPGTSLFCTLPESPVRSQGIWINGRCFRVAGTKLCELHADGTFDIRGTVANDGKAVSIATSTIELLIVSAGHSYCYTLATNVLTNVTASMAGTPLQVVYSDGYFVVLLANTNKFQVSGILDGNTWPGLQVNEVSVFAENCTSIAVLHRELWLFGERHAQPYQDTGSDNVFDVIPGVMIEKGNGPTFSPCILDNTVFWIDEDERGARVAWRANGYTPQRISTHAVEIDLQSYASIDNLTSYSMQMGGHIWWVLYVPGSSWSWVFDIGEGVWFKLAKWTNTGYKAHWGWNHVYAFGKHLIGDWDSGNVYELSLNNLTDNGSTIRRLRRTPTGTNSMQRVFYSEMFLDLDTGLGPQPPLVDGNGDPRAPEIIMRWSDNGGKTWSNDHTRPCGQAGEYGTIVRFQRLGQGRRRLWEFVVTDPIAWTINDGFVEAA